MVDINNLQLNPLVSFVVNCYNGEIYLKGCLSSILAQTYSNWELVFWDNASTDTSAEIFKSYDDNRFKYFKSSKNVTLGQARAWAVNECKGEYIAFLDVDDEWIPEKTEIQVREILKDNYVLSYAGIIELNELTKKSKIWVPKYSSGEIFSKNLNQFEINMPTSMIKKESLLSKNLNFDYNIHASEEYCLFMQLIYNEKVCIIKKPLATYLLRNNSLTVECSNLWTHERNYTLNKILATHSEASLKYKLQFKEAFARADYYHVRSLLINDEVSEAKIIMKKISQNSLKYFFLYLLLLISSNLWKYIIKLYYQR